MFEIIGKQELAGGLIVRLDIAAPKISRKILPGQFVIMRVNETGERIPLTVADNNSEGVITVYFQVIGKTTALLRSLNKGDFIRDVAGPLGNPSTVKNFGTVAVVGGGTGIAILHYLAKGLKASGNYVIGIMGARNKDLIIMEEKMMTICDDLAITTDDGSHGLKGFVTDALEKYLKHPRGIGKVFAAGPIVMMKNVCAMTKKFNVPTVVSLNPIMVDGTGMCGGCRVHVGGEVKFCCVDGPDFDGHKVDFDELEKRNALYANDEKDSLLFSIK